MQSHRNATVNPVSNTGLKCQTNAFEIGIDWLQFACSVPSEVDAKNLIEWMCGNFDDVPVFRWGVTKTYGCRWEHSGVTGRGASFAINPPLDGKQCRVWASFPASACRVVSVPRMRAILEILLIDYQADITRLDIALDDYTKLIDKRWIEEAFANGNVARFAYLDIRMPKRLGVADNGFCVYMGSPQSDKRVRFYDKSVESNGETDCHRWELQLRGERAKSAVREFVQIDRNAGELMASFLSGCVVGAVDFVDHESGDRLSRRNRLAWWNEFVERVGACVRVAIPAVRRTIRRTIDWIEAQVETSLAMCREYMGNTAFQDWLYRKLEEGKRRFNDVHLAILSTS